MINRYPDRPVTASDGSSFRALCIYLAFTFLHITLRSTEGDWQADIHIGDTYEGDECKHLQKSRDRLHIEVAERSSLISLWHPSGIFCERTRYWCGNNEDVFVFNPLMLRDWYNKKRPRVVWYGQGQFYENEVAGRELATIKSFVLSKEDAQKICLWRFQMIDGTWRCLRPSAIGSKSYSLRSRASPKT